MQTIRELFEEISSNRRRWSYYSNPNISIRGVWEDSDGDAALNFIKRYFSLANKSGVFRDKQLCRKESYIKARSNHIISTFLLGIKIAESFNIDCDIRSDEGFNFKYYWFLSCLYHDIGYAYEKNRRERQLSMIRVDGLDALQQICDIKYLDDRVFQSLTREQVDIYLKGRATSRCGYQAVIDHGIVGGLLIYDRLRKQYEESWKNRTNTSDERTSFYVNTADGRRLHLSDRHYDAYAYVADAIIRHNVFNDTLKIYMNELQLCDRYCFDRKISIVSNVLGFVLGIADTIEPSKRGIKYIDEVKIEELQTEPGIRLLVTDKIYNKLYSNIDSLSDWLCVNVEVTAKEGEMVIEIKN